MIAKLKELNIDIGERENQIKTRVKKKRTNKKKK